MSFSEKEQYTVFKIPKRRGGFRVIESPNDELKRLQRESVKRLRYEFELKVSPFAHAFEPYKNIATMAAGHVGKNFVGSMDIKDFFPSIKFENFLKVLEKFNKVKITKELEEELKIHFCDFGDGKGLRLPQGAPGSPFLSNVYLASFDWRMAWITYRMDLDYSRYADDFVISGNWKHGIIKSFKIAEEMLLYDYKLKINREKTKIKRKSQRQLVCGVVVNEKLNLPREWRKRLRAEKFQQRIQGITEEGFRNETKGKIAFEKMIRENNKETYSSREYLKMYEQIKKTVESV